MTTAPVGYFVFPIFVVVWVFSFPRVLYCKRRISFRRVRLADRGERGLSPVLATIRIGPKFNYVGANRLLSNVTRRAGIPDRPLQGVRFRHVLVPHRTFRRLRPNLFTPVIRFRSSGHALSYHVRFRFSPFRFHVVWGPHFLTSSRVQLCFAGYNRAFPGFGFRILRFIFAVRLFVCTFLFRFCCHAMFNRLLRVSVFPVPDGRMGSQTTASLLLMRAKGVLRIRHYSVPRRFFDQVAIRAFRAHAHRFLKRITREQVVIVSAIRRHLLSHLRPFQLRQRFPSRQVRCTRHVRHLITLDKRRHHGESNDPFVYVIQRLMAATYPMYGEARFPCFLGRRQ